MRAPTGGCLWARAVILLVTVCSSSGFRELESHSNTKCKVCAEPAEARECVSGQHEIEGVTQLLLTDGDEYTVSVVPAPTASFVGSGAPTVEPEKITVKLSEIALLFCQNNYEVIPTEIGRLSRLRSMTFDTINVTLTIPTQIGLLQELTSMVFDSNTQVLRLPTQIGLLKNLDRLRLRRSGLTGTIPSQIGRLVNMTALDLSSNSFAPVLFPDALVSWLIDIS